MYTTCNYYKLRHVLTHFNLSPPKYMLFAKIAKLNTSTGLYHGVNYWGTTYKSKVKNEHVFHLVWRVDGLIHDQSIQSLVSYSLAGFSWTFTYTVPSLWNQWLCQSTWRLCHSGIASWPPRSRLDPASGTGNRSWAGLWGRSTAVPRQSPTALHWQLSAVHSTNCHHLHTCNSSMALLLN